MPRVTDPTKRVTDPVAIAHLQRQGKVADNWELFQDYAPRSLGKEHSPFAKFYRNTDNLSEGMMVVSGLPMVDADGVKCDPRWFNTGSVYQIRNNVFSAMVNDVPGRITLTCKNDQPDLIRKKNDKVTFSPQLFVSGVEIARPSVSLLPVDPMNPNYTENTLEWDYGVCSRNLRTVEGRIHGYWIFPANPGGEVRIVYNQTGQYRLKLGQYAVDNDTEVIPASVFAGAVYPFEISDSATYNPDANPETTSVDGYTSRNVVPNGELWASMIAGAGTGSSDSSTSGNGAGIEVYIDAVSPNFTSLHRAIHLFDTSGLPDAANISAATLSIYGESKTDTLSASPTDNIYSSNPASNIALVNADFTTFGSTPYATGIAFDDWSITGYNDFTLNADGRNAISKTGVSKFGRRNANYDVAEVAPTWAGSNRTTFMVELFAEQGAGYKPKLVVTYTPFIPKVFIL